MGASRKPSGCGSAFSPWPRWRRRSAHLLVAIGELVIAPAAAAYPQGHEDVLDRQVAALAELHRVGGEHRVLLAGDGAAGDVVDEVAAVAAISRIPFGIVALRLRALADMGRQIAVDV